MSPAVTLRVDPSLLQPSDGKEPISAVARRLIAEAIEDERPLHLDKPPRVASVRVHLSVPDEVGLRKAYKAWLAISPYKGTFTQYLSALVNAHAAPKPKRAPGEGAAAVEKLLAIQGKKKRKAQEELVSGILRACAHNKILMGEGATGTGKGLACVAAAYLLQREHGGTVVVAAPTYTLLRQLHEDLEKLMQGRASVPVAVSLGAQEFVSEARLRSLLEEQDDARWRKEAAGIQRWLKKAGAGGGTFDIPWTMESFANAAPVDFPFAEVALRRDDDAEADAGAQAFETQRDTCRNFKGVLLATHAMLAVDCMVRRNTTSKAKLDDKSYRVKRDAAEKRGQPVPRFRLDNDARIAALEHGLGVLPDHDFLIMDEAHQFPQTMKSITQSEVSLFSLRISVRKLASKLSAQLVHDFEAAYSRLVSVAEERGVRVVSIKNPAAADPIGTRCRECVLELPALLQRMQAQIKDLRHRSDATRHAAREIQAALESVKSIQAVLKKGQERQEMRVGVNFTPVRLYPRIYSQRSNVAPLLDFLWQTLRGGAVVSATLYTPTLHEQHTPTYMQHELALRLERLLTMTPYTPAWLTESVTLHLPEESRSGGRLWLAPPSQSRTGNLKRADQKVFVETWQRELAAAISHIAERARGGTLALFTSYADLEAVLRELGTTRALQPRLIPDPGVEQLRYIKFKVLCDRFVELGGEGERPLWLATGQAWTGLNLTLKGVPASADQLLTDLVITRLPFASEALATDEDHRAGYQKRILETALRLRQGMGRLVRREGLEGRGLWILDARLVDHQQRKSFGPVIQVLTPYLRRRTFTRAEAGLSTR